MNTTRYPRHPPVIGPRMVIGGADLGAAMTPCDLLIALRNVLGLDDREIVEAMHAAGDRVERDIQQAEPAPALSLLPEAERAALIDVARAVTPSRLTAWRRRHRQMTWPELRLLLLGLRIQETPDA